MQGVTIRGPARSWVIATCILFVLTVGFAGKGCRYRSEKIAADAQAEAFAKELRECEQKSDRR